ncbi:hypothetical protein Ddye_028393 [Dipteronia dyeriana]|uniref:Uncharacterized protein n=1 Tax=Dipteronia dyeriana TaxID=168575 RepID=A0AAD9TRU8_9ROSI|nr:hypothetical protein Ddye_028393 [Dipteronia dyeriana]
MSDDLVSIDRCLVSGGRSSLAVNHPSLVTSYAFVRESERDSGLVVVTMIVYSGFCGGVGSRFDDDGVCFGFDDGVCGCGGGSGLLGLCW